MPFLKFLLLSTAGTAIWNTILVLIGMKVGENWQDILAYLDAYSYTIYALLLIGMIGYLFWRKKRHAKKAVKNE